MLKDRYELLTASQTAILLYIPLICIYYCEVSKGKFDGAIRHTITNMTNVHLSDTKGFSGRIKQLGKKQKSTFVTVLLCLDNVPCEQKYKLERDLVCILNVHLSLVSYRCVTKVLNSDENDISPFVVSHYGEEELVFESVNGSFNVDSNILKFNAKTLITATEKKPEYQRGDMNLD